MFVSRVYFGDTRQTTDKWDRPVQNRLSGHVRCTLFTWRQYNKHFSSEAACLRCWPATEYWNECDQNRDAVLLSLRPSKAMKFYCFLWKFQGNSTFRYATTCYDANTHWQWFDNSRERVLLKWFGAFCGGNRKLSLWLLRKLVCN